MRDYNYFYCYRCNKHTKHIRLTLREYNRDDGDNRPAQVAFDVVCDGMGFTNIMGLLGGPKYYKCCECGKTYIDE